MEIFTTLLQSLIPIAKEMPWFLITAFIVWGLYKSAKFLAEKLFNEDKGLIITFFKSQSLLFDSIKQNNDKMSELLSKNVESIDNMREHQIKILSELDINADQIKDLKSKIIEFITHNANDKNLFTVLVDDTSLPLLFADRNLKLTKVNTALCLLLGYTPDEIQTKTLKDIVIEKNNSTDDIMLGKVIHGEVDRYRMERTFISKAGKEIPVALHLFRHPKSGEFVNYIAMIFPLKHEDMIN